MPRQPESLSATEKKRPSVSAPERLFSLVLALVATESGLTKADILANVQGYRQRYTLSGSNESLERQFERDKDDIRELGIPLETIAPPDDSGSNHLLRYRIPKGLYDLPADVTFTPGEVSLLKLAGTVWREGSLSKESRRALMKLDSLGIEPSEPVLGYAPLLRTKDQSFDPLSKALDRLQVVAFLYLKPGDLTPVRRVVAPRALVQHEGRWHLYATDEVAKAPRTFLLARIVGVVVVQTNLSPFTQHDSKSDSGETKPTESERALSELDVLWAANVARIVVVEGTDAALRLGARQAAQRLAEADTDAMGFMRTLHFTDLNIFADELAAFGPEVFVEGPVPLQRAVRERLLTARDAHAKTILITPADQAPRRRIAATTSRGATAASPRVAGDQLTLLLSLVPYLIDQESVSVNEVAEHFGLSAERVRGLVRLIALSGVPGETRQYLHGDLFDIVWDEFETNDRIVLTHQVAIDDSPRFSAREAAALIAGLQYLSALPDNIDANAIATVMAKLTRGASAPPIQVAVAQRDSGMTRDTVHAALTSGMQIEFDYLSARGGHEHRVVDPLRLESVDTDWYLRGWCHLREAVRTFRLDRMSNPRVTVAPRANNPSDVLLPATLFQESSDDVDVRLELATTALPLLADYNPERSEPVDSGFLTRTTLRFAHAHALKRLVTGLSGIVTVLEPAESRRIVFDWAAAGLQQYYVGVQPPVSGIPK